MLIKDGEFIEPTYRIEGEVVGVDRIGLLRMRNDNNGVIYTVDPFINRLLACDDSTKMIGLHFAFTGCRTFYDSYMPHEVEDDHGYYDLEEKPNRERIYGIITAPKVDYEHMVTKELTTLRADLTRLKEENAAVWELVKHQKKQIEKLAECLDDTANHCPNIEYSDGKDQWEMCSKCGDEQQGSLTGENCWILATDTPEHKAARAKAEALRGKG